MDGRDRPPPDSEDERRRHLRSGVALLVEYEDVDELVRDFTEDLSAGGTFVCTNRELEIGTAIQLELSFPGLLQAICLEGVVRWTRSEPPEERGIGIEFVHKDDAVRDRLQSILLAVEARDPEFVTQLFNILVVEDNPHVAQLIRDGLSGGASSVASNLEFEFQTCGDGGSALELINTQRFDCVIVDINLPVIDGAEVIRRIRGAAETASLPVIAVSAGGTTAMQSAVGAGADFFIAKPMRLRNIIDTMRKLMSGDEPE